jgi:DNA-binding CsgD family transcriptional regulator
MKLESLHEALSAWSRAIASSQSIEAVADLFRRTIRPLGLTCSACGMVTGAKSLSQDPFYFTDWPSEWRALYFSKGFVSIDPLPRYAIASGAAASWSSIKSKLPSKDPGHAVYKAANDWGFTEGLAMPLRSADGDLGLMTMGGARDKLSASEIDFLSFISLSAFQLIDGRLTDAPSLQISFPFTAREKECIALLRSGLTDKEIARTLGVGTTTVISHLENARKKVGAKSRSHLAFISPK